MGQIWLSAEISNLSQPASGHWYFTLKDDRAQVRCAMFRNSNRRVTFRPQNGQQVLVRASITLYEPRGDYQLIAEHAARRRRPAAATVRAVETAPERRRAVRSAIQAAAARPGKTRRGDHLRQRRGAARYSAGIAAARSVAADRHLPHLGAGRGSADADRARHRDRQPPRRMRRADRRPRRRFVGGSVELQRRTRGAGDLRQPHSDRQRRRP